IDRVYPEGIFRVEGGYRQFLEKKEAFLLAQSSRQESLANRVRREVEWLRRGAKGRTGKSKARIDEAGGKELGGRRLFRDLSFTLTPGTRLGLLGRNGTGKTTLLRLLAGELQPDSGAIERAPGLR